MKVFISWSGEASKRYAVVLRDWIPTILPNVNPWVSSEDIEKGKRWSGELSRELESCDSGIICLDPSNMNSSWLHFEAGALSKSVEFGSVFPLLFGLQASDVSGPLSQFQVTTFDHDDVVRLLNAIAARSEESVNSETIAKRVKYSWAVLQQEIGQFADSVIVEEKQHATRENEIDKDSTGLDETSINILLALAHSKDTHGSMWLDPSKLVKQLDVPTLKLEHLIKELYIKGLITKSFGTIGISDAGLKLLLENRLL